MSNESLLHYACLCCNVNIDVIKPLIENYGCDPNVVTESNQSLLHYACQCGNLEAVRYLINKQHLDPFMRDNINQLEPLDYAVNSNQYNIAVYICRHCISSDELLNPNRIKTTIHLMKFIFNNIIMLRPNTWACSGADLIWKTADGDNIFQLTGSSKTCIAHISSAIVLEILNSHNADILLYISNLI